MPARTIDEPHDRGKQQPDAKADKRALHGATVGDPPDETDHDRQDEEESAGHWSGGGHVRGLSEPSGARQPEHGVQSIDPVHARGRKEAGSRDRSWQLFSSAGAPRLTTRQS